MSQSTHLSAYRQLAQRLDTIPNGFPATESGIELKLLAKLYTPEQAELAAVMRLTPEPAEAIAARVGWEPAAAYNALKDMARLGLIRAQRGEQGLAFGLMPFVVGVYESQLARMDEELARLFEAYFQESFGREVLSTPPSVHRIIPVEQSIPVDLEVFPYERASQLLEGANSFGVRDCICRVEKRLLGQGCDHPVENCLVFHPAENAFERSRTIRTISKEEALRILRQATEAGLVHSSANVQKGHGYICNCCTCCCGILRGLTEFGNAEAMARSNFHATVDSDLCIACATCLEVCPFGALSLPGDIVEVDLGRCMGCGLCVPACPSEALSLLRKPETEITPPPLDEEAWLMERARSRGIPLHEIL